MKMTLFSGYEVHQISSFKAISHFCDEIFCSADLSRVLIQSEVCKCRYLRCGRGMLHLQISNSPLSHDLPPRPEGH